MRSNFATTTTSLRDYPVHQAITALAVVAGIAGSLQHNDDIEEDFVKIDCNGMEPNRMAFDTSSYISSITTHDGVVKAEVIVFGQSEMVIELEDPDLTEYVSNRLNSSNNDQSDGYVQYDDHGRIIRIGPIDIDNIEAALCENRMDDEDSFDVLNDAFDTVATIVVCNVRTDELEASTNDPIKNNYFAKYFGENDAVVTEPSVTVAVSETKEHRPLSEAVVTEPFVTGAVSETKKHRPLSEADTDSDTAQESNDRTSSIVYGLSTKGFYRTSRRRSVCGIFRQLLVIGAISTALIVAYSIPK